MGYTHYAPGANEAELVNGVFQTDQTASACGPHEFRSTRVDQVARRRSRFELGPEIGGGTTDEDCVVRDERETPTNRGGGDP